MTLKDSVLASLVAAVLTVAGGTNARADTLLPAGQCSINVHCLTRAMPWHTNLEQAREAAGKSGRLVFWMHMLGTIDGAT